MGLAKLKIVLHLGFPKTGSSSLQFGPLLDLEKSNHLILNTWRKLNINEPLKDRPSSRLFQNFSILEDYISFSKDKLNVLSDESFTAPMRLRKLNFGKDICSPFEFPKKIHSAIMSAYKNEDIDFQILVVIREQSKLITSQYVEEYNWKRYKNIDLLFDTNGMVDLNGYEIYKFSEYLNLLTSLFGFKNCNFLMFEEFVNLKHNFCSKLDGIFNVKENFFYDSFSKHHINNRNKNELGSFTKDGKYFIPKFRSEILSQIKDFYIEDNKKLTKFFSKETLLKYNYL
tara:strand:+ start:199 stop:1053 length:855 start_codon:yes stop_codon:yes gene_type:complete